MKKETKGSPAISVIVPIYNMERLMRKCLDSILAQTFLDYECLLIDDGSKDGSPIICDEYADKDSRFRAFHKPNGGLSDARNFGLAHSKGEYTIFVDPDDWVEKDCLMDMYGKAQESDADMVICDYYNDDSLCSSYYKQKPTSLHHEDVLKDILRGKLFGYTWNKLLKQNLYVKYNLHYPVGIYGCEDQYTMCSLLKNDIKITYLPQAFYHYMHYDNYSLSRKYNEDTPVMDKKIRDMFVQLLNNSDCEGLAYECKTVSMVNRAFLYGDKVFSSKSFCESFGKYKNLVLNNTSGYMKLFQILSFWGFYHFSRRVFGLLFQIKQLFKRIKRLV